MGNGRDLDHGERRRLGVEMGEGGEGEGSTAVNAKGGVARS